MNKIVEFSAICLAASILFISTNAFAKNCSKNHSSEIQAIRISTGPIEQSHTRSVPEPSTMILFGSGLFVFGLALRKNIIR